MIGTGQAGKGNIILTANPSTMDDGEYLLVANDGRALTQSTAELPATLRGPTGLPVNGKCSTPATLAGWT